VFHGENAHESVIRAVAQLGLGSRRAICVPVKNHRMDTEVLAGHIRDAVRSGTKVMAVVATAASSTTGAFDDIDTIGRICREHAIWFHVDGAHGATALLSDTHRHRLRGIECAHSVTWDPHKMMLMPLPASAVLVRDAALLDRAFRADRARSNTTRDCNLGPRSFMTSRRADALKLWVGLLRYGADGIGAIYDHLCRLATELHRLLSGRGDFTPLHVPQCNLLCFRYVGEQPLEVHQIDLVNRKIHAQLSRSACSFIATGNLDGRFVLRATLMNPRTQEAHLHELLNELAAIGRRVLAEHR
jgi:L-2,4-diaminobutyrate decarboxylase